MVPVTSEDLDTLIVQSAAADPARRQQLGERGTAYARSDAAFEVEAAAFLSAFAAARPAVQTSRVDNVPAA